jgi:hypothetical protein
MQNITNKGIRVLMLEDSPADAEHIRHELLKDKVEEFDLIRVTTKEDFLKGLGLAVLYGIIKQHKGWITVDTENGQGTKLSIYMPVSHKKPAEREDVDVSWKELQFYDYERTG